MIVVADVIRRLEEAEIPYAIGVSLASRSWGQVRYTHNSDIAILVDRHSVRQLGTAFPAPYYLSLNVALEMVQSGDEFRAVQVMHTEEALKIDRFLLHGTTYDLGVLDRARHVETPTAVGKVCSPEEIVLTKLQCFVFGNRVSDRQWNDIVQVLEIQKGKSDEACLDRWAEHFNVKDLLDDAGSQTR